MGLRIDDFFSAEHSPRTVAIAVVAFFMAVAFIKGIARQLLGMLCLALGFVAGGLAFRQAPGLYSKWFDRVHPDAVIITSIVVGGIVHQLSRRLFRGMVQPGAGAPQNGGDRFRSALLSLIPAVFVVWVVAMAVRWIGALSLMQHIDEGIRAGKPSLLEKSPLFARLQRTLTTGQIGGLLNKTDPFSTAEAGTLCSLLLIRRDDDSWVRLLRDPLAGPIMHHPALVRLVRDKDWLRTASLANYAELLTLPEVSEALKDSALVEQLRALPVEVVARHALAETPAQE